MMVGRLCAPAGPSSGLVCAPCLGSLGWACSSDIYTAQIVERTLNKQEPALPAKMVKAKNAMSLDAGCGVCSKTLRDFSTLLHGHRGANAKLLFGASFV